MGRHIIGVIFSILFAPTAVFNMPAAIDACLCDYVAAIVIGEIWLDFAAFHGLSSQLISQQSYCDRALSQSCKRMTINGVCWRCMDAVIALNMHRCKSM